MAAVLDLDINEGDTFTMSMELWENEDNTIPLDVSADTFIGSFEFSGNNIPMVMTVSGDANNVVNASVTYAQMGNLPSKGMYDIDQLNTAGERYRLIQGRVRVNPEVTK